MLDCLRSCWPCLCPSPGSQGYKEIGGESRLTNNPPATQTIQKAYTCISGVDPFARLFSDGILVMQGGMVQAQDPSKYEITEVLTNDIKLSDQNLQAFAKRHGQVLREGVRSGIDELIKMWKYTSGFSYLEAEEAVKQIFGEDTTDSDVMFILKIVALHLINPIDPVFTKLVQFARASI